MRNGKSAQINDLFRCFSLGASCTGAEHRKATGDYCADAAYCDVSEQATHVELQIRIHTDQQRR